MTVTISAADAQGHRTEEKLYKEVPTDAARAFLRLLGRKMDTSDLSIFLSDDAEDFNFYGERASDIDPEALKNVFRDLSSFSYEDQQVVIEFGIDILNRIFELGQLVRISVGPGWNDHLAVVVTEGQVAGEPVMNACHSNASHAFKLLGQWRLPAQPINRSRDFGRTQMGSKPQRGRRRWPRSLRSRPSATSPSTALTRARPSSP